MAAWQQGPLGAQVVKHGLEAPTTSAADIAVGLSVSANDLIVQLEALASANQGSEGTLASLLRQLHAVALEKLGPPVFDKLKECLELATKALKQSLEDKEEMKATIQALKREVADLKQSLSDSKQQDEESRQAVLLGQLVYVLEDIVRIQVLGPQFPAMSLAGIQDLIEEGYVSEEGRQKWNTFVARLKKQGLSVKNLMAASGPLRRQRFAVAHGTMEERAQVSPTQLLEWASVRKLEPMVETFLRVLQPLTCEGQPLLPRSDINVVFA